MGEFSTDSRRCNRGAVAKLKKEHNRPLIIFGSGVFSRSLMQHGLIDEFVLMIHPLVLGQGRRFFDNDSPLTNFKLATLLTTDTGAIIGAYLRK